MADAHRPAIADGTEDVGQAAPGDRSRGRPSTAEARAPDAAGGHASMLAAGALMYICTHVCMFVFVCLCVCVCVC